MIRNSSKREGNCSGGTSRRSQQYRINCQANCPKGVSDRNTARKLLIHRSSVDVNLKDSSRAGRYATESRNWIKSYKGGKPARRPPQSNTPNSPFVLSRQVFSTVRSPC